MLTRRTFLLSSAATLGAAACPRSLAAERSPLEKPRLGFIGVGNQGTSNLKGLMEYAVALCDVDSEHLGKARDLVMKSGKVKNVETFSDYRKLLERNDIDAVVITTP